MTQGGVRREISEQLELDVPLAENAMCSRSQGFQHETKMVPKRAKRRKKSREEAKKEKRGENSALQSVRGPLWGEIWSVRARGGKPPEGGGRPYCGARSTTKSLKSVKLCLKSGIWEKGGQ